MPLGTGVAWPRKWVVLTQRRGHWRRLAAPSRDEGPQGTQSHTGYWVGTSTVPDLVTEMLVTTLTLVPLLFRLEESEINEPLQGDMFGLTASWQGWVRL